MRIRRAGATCALDYLFGVARVARPACNQQGSCGGSIKATCGNDFVEPMEACDDGSDISGDGCSAACNVEPLFSCDTGAATSDCACTDVNCVTCDQGCDDGVSCTVDWCDKAGKCHHDGRDALCEDGNPCNTDVCAPKTGCVHTPRPDACSVPIYSFFKGAGANHDHYFSATKKPPAGYTFEGPAFRLFHADASGPIPLYQAYAPTLMDHMHTRDANEAKPVFTDHKAVGNCYPTWRAWAPQPLYRLYSVARTNHLVSADDNERTVLLSSGVYKHGWVLCYVAK